MAKRRKCGLSCETCANCSYTGEGDYVCMLDIPVWVVEDWVPTSEYFFCGGEEWEVSDYA